MLTLMEGSTMFAIHFMDCNKCVETAGYPVYHSMYDDFIWMKKFGDPMFHRHSAGIVSHINQNSMSHISRALMVFNGDCHIS